MDSNGTPKQQLVERLRSANNILVTVSRDPSVDQLAACIGLTLVLNKLGKHATAVFSGQVPSTIEFLQPDDTLEKNTDSLRDFIIALDKSKADKLRYKVEDRVVKIFITPYRTSLSADDLEFSQGDFNVDAVVAIGVHQQQDLDEAIIAHGRILHDATVTTINTAMDAALGSINWHDAAASSLCELVEEVVHDLGSDLLDGQIATALLTGIVAETNRFSNEKTTPQTMSVSAALMSAGANQQLVASELAGAMPVRRDDSPADSNDSSGTPPAPPKSDDGTLEITHPHSEEAPEAENAPETAKDAEAAAPAAPESNPEDEPKAEDSAAISSETEEQAESAVPTRSEEPKPSRIITQPPVLGGTLTASSKPDTEMEAPADPLSLPPVEGSQPILSHSEPAAASPSMPPEPATTPLQPAPAGWVPPEPPAAATEVAPVLVSTDSAAAPEPESASAAQAPPIIDTAAPTTAEAPDTSEDKPEETLTQLEKDVDSPHVEAPDLDAARNEVMDAINSAPPMPEPVQALNAQPIDIAEPAQSEPVDATPSIEFDPKAFGVLNDPDQPDSPSAAASLPVIHPDDASVTPADPTVPPVPPPLPSSVYNPPANTGPQ